MHGMCTSTENAISCRSFRVLRRALRKFMGSPLWIQTVVPVGTQSQGPLHSVLRRRVLRCRRGISRGGDTATFLYETAGECGRCWLKGAAGRERTIGGLPVVFFRSQVFCPTVTLSGYSLSSLRQCRPTWVSPGLCLEIIDDCCRKAFCHSCLCGCVVFGCLRDGGRLAAVSRSRSQWCFLRDQPHESTATRRSESRMADVSGNQHVRDRCQQRSGSDVVPD